MARRSPSRRARPGRNPDIRPGSRQGAGRCRGANGRRSGHRRWPRASTRRQSCLCQSTAPRATTRAMLGISIDLPIGARKQSPERVGRPGDLAVVQRKARFQAKLGRDPNAAVDRHRPNPAVADIVGDRQAGRIEEIRLDVLPVAERCAALQVEAIAAGSAIAESGFRSPQVGRCDRAGPCRSRSTVRLAGSPAGSGRRGSALRSAAPAAQRKAGSDVLFRSASRHRPAFHRRGGSDARRNRIARNRCNARRCSPRPLWSSSTPASP